MVYCQPVYWVLGGGFRNKRFQSLKSRPSTHSIRIASERSDRVGAVDKTTWGKVRGIQERPYILMRHIDLWLWADRKISAVIERALDLETKWP